MRKETKNFIDLAHKSIKKHTFTRNNNYHKIIINHINSLPKRALGRLFSDPYWIKYPTYSMRRRTFTSDKNKYKKIYGFIISEVCRSIAISNGNVFNVLYKKSVGIWALFCSDNIHGKQRTLFLKRFINSSDNRVRLRVAKNLPVSEIRKMNKDSYIGVRNVIIKRIGMDNCYDLFLDDKNIWIKRQAFTSAKIEAINYKEIINSYRLLIEKYEANPNEENIRSLNEVENILPSILKKMPIGKLPFYMDIKGTGSSPWRKRAIEEVFRFRMSGELD